MFFILSKILHFLLMPLSWSLGCLLYAGFSSHKKRKKIAFWLGLGILLLFSSPLVVDNMMQSWEEPPKTFESIAKHDIGIVLTGVLNLEKSPKDRPYFNKGADRIHHAVLLYNMKKIDKILITGGNIEFGEGKIFEAEILKQYALSSGIPEKDILVEKNAKNTYQNAVFTKDFLQKAGLVDKKLILLSSSYHMRRSKLCFDKVGLKTTTFSTDFYASDNFNWEQLLPSQKSLFISGVLMHEWFGLLTYKLMGYI